MFRKSFVILMVAVILSGLSVKIYALVPHFINYQGKLSIGPIPLNGTFTMTFRIYDTAIDGTSLWEEIRTVEAKQGIFNVILGEVTPLEILFDQDYWLGVQIWPDSEMIPRQRIVSVGYSYMAEDSYFLAGHTAGPGNGLDADTVDGVHAANLEESAETDNKIATHKADSGAHHTKTTSFSELTDTATDDQIPNDITIEHATAADRATTSEHANTADMATTAKHATTADRATTATTAGDADTIAGKHVDELLDISKNTQNKLGGLNIGGNLGIGTSSPEAKLHVIGGIQSNGVVKIDDYNANNHINTYESGSGYPLIYSRYFYGHYNDLIIQAADGYYNTNIHLVTGDPPSQRMVIMDNGKVGIGTPNPTENLHVAGNIKVDGGLKVDGMINGSINGDADTVDGKHANELLDVSANTQNKLGGLNIGGNLGIGTTSPGAELDVDGTVKAKAFQGDGSGLTGISGQWVGSGDISYSGGNVGIGTSSPAENLHVAGNLRVDGSIIGSIDVSNITGLLGQGYSLAFPNILNNYTDLEIEGIAAGSDYRCVILHGPGVDIERIHGWRSSKPYDQPGLSDEHALIFEAPEPYATEIKAWFDDAAPFPRSGSIIIRNLAGNEVFRWNFFEGLPNSYEAGMDGRTKFTIDLSTPPNNSPEWQEGNGHGSDLARNMATDKLVEISGVGNGSYLAFEEWDQANRTITFTYDWNEGSALWDWVQNVLIGAIDAKRDMSIVEQDANGMETSRRNYYGVFPIKYEMYDGFGLNTKIKSRIVISYDFWEDA